jgi:hypothetical protein
MTIESFISLVDKVIQNKVGVSVHDLPDFCFADYFEEDFTADEARDAAEDCASELLYDAGYMDY